MHLAAPEPGSPRASGPPVRDPEAPRRVTLLELFFDLVYVVALALISRGNGRPARLAPSRRGTDHAGRRLVDLDDHHPGHRPVQPGTHRDQAADQRRDVRRAADDHGDPEGVRRSRDRLRRHVRGDPPGTWAVPDAGGTPRTADPAPGGPHLHLVRGVGDPVAHRRIRQRGRPDRVLGHRARHRLRRLPARVPGAGARGGARAAAQRHRGASLRALPAVLHHRARRRHPDDRHHVQHGAQRGARTSGRSRWRS